MSSLISKISKAIGSTFGASASPSKATSSKVARDRLSVILASQRGSELLQGVDMELLQQDVLSVVKKHVSAVAKDKPIQFQVRNDGEVNLMEMQVELESSRGRATMNTAVGRI